MKTSIRFFCSLLIITLLGACAAKQQPFRLSETAAEKAIAMKASDYKFEPNTIEAKAGDEITFRIENTSKKMHNFTILDPSGKVLQEVDLPPEKTIPVKVTLAEKGTYKFHCDKPFHTTFGMKGSVTAE